MCVALHTLCGSNCILLCSPRVLYWVSEDITCRRESRSRTEFTTGVSILLIVWFCQSLMCKKLHNVMCSTSHPLWFQLLFTLFSSSFIFGVRGYYM
jgi:hypothetical protein